MTNQKKQIIEHIEKHGFITFAIAYDEYGIANLKGRIHELREDDGYNIVSVPIPFVTRLGKNSQYVQYCLLDNLKTS